MSIERLINRLTEYFSQLYYRYWERWELLTIGIAVLLLLFFVLKAHRKAKARRRREHDYSSIIGKNLTDRNREQ